MDDPDDFCLLLSRHLCFRECLYNHNYYGINLQAGRSDETGVVVVVVAVVVVAVVAGFPTSPFPTTSASSRLDLH
jgi:hypothetical protein